ncbi:MAG TPA: nucleotidyltransferase domain-containing protein [Patescibacteria group bacterium]|nr:nucleotidyltransferase domain-containing protein [Patescibacteria group bacterium]
MLTNDEIQTIREYFAHAPEVEAVYLYGSQARGDETEKSDIDIAVIFKNNAANSLYLRGRFAEDLKHTFKTTVDIQNMETCDVSFAYRIIQEGKLLYTAKEQNIDTFIVDLMRRYFDLKPTHDAYFHELSTRMKALSR